MKKKFMKRAGAGTLAVLMAAFGLAACGSTDSGSGDNTQVVLNEVAHSIFYAPMYVAIEEGYFADEGIDLTLVTGFGADKTMTAVLTDEAGEKRTSGLWVVKVRSILMQAEHRTML